MKIETTKDRDKDLSSALSWCESAPANRFVLKPFYWLIPIAIWSLIVSLSLFHNIQEINNFSKQTAANKGRFVFQMVEDMRLWNARHGGVYVNKTLTSPSNPYLNVPDKDIVSTKGHELTMVNPAYMTRQLAGIIRENSKTIVNITSLKPINPNNIADEWERKSLQSFEMGVKETSDFLQVGEVKLFRYMAPLMTKKACLKCHLHQGYKEGDVRGGISISFDSTLLLNIKQQQKLTQHFLHGGVWFLLTSMTLMALWRLRKQVIILIANNKHQEEIVNIRTKDLREESRKRHETEAQFRRFINASAEGIVALGLEGECSFANPQSAKLLGLETPEQLIGKDFHKLCGHKSPVGEISPHNCAILDCLKKGVQAHSDKELFSTVQGQTFPVDYVVSPVLENDERIGAILTFSNITNRKAKESELLKLSTAVNESPASTLITDKDGRIEYVNKRFCEITGYSEEDIIGKNPRILKSGHTPHDVYENMWATLKKGNRWKGEIFNRKKDGSLFWEESLISPITDAYGQISHFVAVKRDITEYKMEMNEVWRQANYDVLTNLPNRNLFEDRLENAVALAGREERTLAILFIDLDGFKDINDSFGHEAGDHVLKITAERLQGCLRQSDTAARLGGDEFVIILQDSHSIQAVENVAHKILEKVSKTISHKSNSLNVSASIGISIMPRDTVVASDLLRFADIAMYDAKQQGKSRFCHYQDLSACKPRGI